MQEELPSLETNDTWELVPQTLDMNVIKKKQVFKVKYNQDNLVERLKARHVAKGFNKKVGLDYLKTFSPVVKPPTVCLVLSLVVTNTWKVHQLDVRNILLNDVFTKQPLSLKHQVSRVQHLPMLFVNSRRLSMASSKHHTYGLADLVTF